MCDIKEDKNCCVSCSWQNKLQCQVRQRNLVELEPLSSIFDSYSVLRNRACLSINAEKVITRLHQERELLSSRVRDLERAVADNSVRSLLELDQRNRYEVLLKRLQTYEVEENEYKEGKRRLEETEQKLTETNEKFVQAESDLSRCRSELSLISREYNALKDENTQMRRRITDADRCLLEMNSEKTRSAALLEQLNALKRQVEELNKKATERGRQNAALTSANSYNTKMNDMQSASETSKTASSDACYSNNKNNNSDDKNNNNNENRNESCTNNEVSVLCDKIHLPGEERSEELKTPAFASSKHVTASTTTNQTLDTSKHDDTQTNTPTQYHSHKAIAAAIDAHHGANIHALCVLDEMKKIATSGSDKLIRVWSLRHSSINYNEKNNNNDNTNSNNNDVNSGNNDSEVVEEERRRIHTNNSVALSLHCVGHYLAAGCADHLVRLWDVNTLRGIELSGHEEKVVSVCMSASAQHIFTASSDSTIKLWDARQRMALRTFLCTSTANDVTVSGGSVFSAHYNGTVVMWDRRSATRTCETRVHGRITTCVRVSQDGLLCVSLGRDNCIAVRDTRVIQRPLYTLTSPNLVVPMNWSRLGLANDGRSCAVGSASGEIKLFALEPITNNNSFSSSSLELSPSSSSPSVLHSGSNNCNNSNNTVAVNVINNSEIETLQAQTRQTISSISANRVTGHERNKPMYGVTWFASSNVTNGLVSFGEDRRVVFWRERKGTEPNQRY